MGIFKTIVQTILMKLSKESENWHQATTWWRVNTRFGGKAKI